MPFNPSHLKPEFRLCIISLQRNNFFVNKVNKNSSVVPKKAVRKSILFFLAKNPPSWIISQFYYFALALNIAFGRGVFGPICIFGM